MATRFVAVLGLAAATFFVTLGNFWFTYGLWPRNWVAFWGFFAATLTLQALLRAVQAEGKK